MQRNTLFDHVLIVLRTIMIFVVVLHLKSNFALTERFLVFLGMVHLFFHPQHYFLHQAG